MTRNVSAHVVSIHGENRSTRKRGRLKTYVIDTPCTLDFDTVALGISITAKRTKSTPDGSAPDKECVRVYAAAKRKALQEVLSDGRLRPSDRRVFNAYLELLNVIGYDWHSIEGIRDACGEDPLTKAKLNKRTIIESNERLGRFGHILRRLVPAKGLGQKPGIKHCSQTTLPTLMRFISIEWDARNAASAEPSKVAQNSSEVANNSSEVVLKSELGGLQGHPNYRNYEEDSPPPPQRGRERGNSYSDLIKQIRADGKLPVVVEHLIVPLLGSLTIQHPDPIALLRDIRDQRSIAERPAKVLDRLATLLKERRKKLISTKDVLDLVNEASNGFEMRKIHPDHPSWAAWCEDLKKQGLSKMIRFYEGQGHMMQWTEWPNWHAQFRAESANGRSA